MEVCLIQQGDWDCPRPRWEPKIWANFMTKICGGWSESGLLDICCCASPVQRDVTTSRCISTLNVWEMGIIPQALPSQGHQMDLGSQLAIFQLCLLFLITCRIWDTPKSPSLLNLYTESLSAKTSRCHCWCDKNRDEWISNCQDSLHFPTKSRQINPIPNTYQIHRIVYENGGHAPQDKLVTF